MENETMYDFRQFFGEFNVRVGQFDKRIQFTNKSMRFIRHYASKKHPIAVILIAMIEASMFPVSLLAESVCSQAQRQTISRGWQILQHSIGR